MTTAGPQHLSSVDEYFYTRRSASDEPSNARSTTPLVPKVAEKHRKRTVLVPPPAPSPPPPLSFQRSTISRSPSPLNQGAFVAMPVDDLEAQSQWLFTEEEIQNSPSVQDGITTAEEGVRRAKGVNFIVQAGILLKIPQLTLGTAAVFFHRFYMRYSMVSEKGSGIHHYNIAATALFLATKAEENCRKTKEIVIAVAKVAQKNASLIIDEQSKEFWRWKDSILMYEETMLELLTFDVVLESPYNFLYSFLKELNVESNKPLRNVAWAFLNDSCMTMLCLLMQPKDIAIAALYFSVKSNKQMLPDSEDGHPWWVRLNGNPERIFKAIDIMADFYTDNPLKKSDNPYDHSPDDGFEALERTRRRAETASPSSGPRADQAEANESSQQSVAANGITESQEKQIEGHINGHAGDDDAPLKAIANDPATHEDTQQNGVNGISPKSPNATKRKEAETGDSPESKRPKVGKDEESEEGEVEE